MIPLFLPVKTRLHQTTGRSYWSASASVGKTNYVGIGDTEAQARRRLVSSIEEAIVTGMATPPPFWSGSTVPYDAAVVLLSAAVFGLLVALGFIFYSVVNG